MRVPASCHWSPWIAFAREKWGDPASRALAEDALTIARSVTTHDELARLHAVATLFDSAEGAARVTERDLADLTAADVADAPSLAVVQRLGAPAEVLRAAAELELPNIASLPRDDVDLDVASMTAVVPELASFELRAVRPLGVRGRVMGKTIFVGVSDAEHMALQAAHEAIVASLPMGSYVDVERRAIAELERRAGAAGMSDAHARWIARFDLGYLASSNTLSK